MSLDVSPDGKTIALDLLDDVYTLPIEGSVKHFSRQSFDYTATHATGSNSTV